MCENSGGESLTVWPRLPGHPSLCFAPWKVGGSEFGCDFGWTFLVFQVVSFSPCSEAESHFSCLWKYLSDHKGTWAVHSPVCLRPPICPFRVRWEASTDLLRLLVRLLLRLLCLCLDLDRDLDLRRRFFSRLRERDFFLSRLRLRCRLESHPNPY